MNQITTNFEADFKNNKINLRIDSPTLVIPFKQATFEEVNANECWIFRMDCATLENVKSNDFQELFYECFELQIKKVTFCHADVYREWQGGKVPSCILNDFTTSVVLARKRDASELRSEEDKESLLSSELATIGVAVNLVDKVRLDLTPRTFFKLTKLPQLLSTGAKPDQHYVAKREKRLMKAKIKSDVNKLSSLSF